MTNSCPTRRMALEIITTNQLDAYDYEGSPLDFNFSEKMIAAVESYVATVELNDLQHGFYEAGQLSLYAAIKGVLKQRSSCDVFVAALIVAVWDALETEGLIEHVCPLAVAG